MKNYNVYIFDTGIFIVANSYYPKLFPTFWEKLEHGLKKGEEGYQDLFFDKGDKSAPPMLFNHWYISVESVWEEIVDGHSYNRGHLIEWKNHNKHYFYQPTQIDLENIKRVIVKFPNILNAQAKYTKGREPADPYVISKAMTLKEMGLQSVVVCIEEYDNSVGPVEDNGKPYSTKKVPNICEYFDVRCITPEEFMAEVGWRFE